MRRKGGERKGGGKRQGETTQVKGDNILFTERVPNRNIALQREDFGSLNAGLDCGWAMCFRTRISIFLMTWEISGVTKLV